VYIILIVTPYDVYICTGLNAMSFLYNAVFPSVTVKEFFVTPLFIFLNCYFVGSVIKVHLISVFVKWANQIYVLYIFAVMCVE
jgi:hypothetical protein